MQKKPGQYAQYKERKKFIKNNSGKEIGKHGNRISHYNGRYQEANHSK